MTRTHFRRPILRAAAIATLASIGTLLPAAPAWAHTRLTKSEPSAGAKVGTLPTVLRFWFSERPELSMTRISLTDAAGHAVRLGAVEKDESALAVRCHINGNLAPGQYKVTWKTAASDGHPARGSFSFVILPEAVRRGAGSSGEAAGLLDDEPTAETPGYIIARALTFAGLLGLIGAVAFRTVIVPRARLEPADAVIGLRIASRVGLVALVVFIAGGVARLFFQTAMMASPDEPTMEMLRSIVFRTRWGWVWSGQIVVGLLALASLLAAKRFPRRAVSAWWLVTCAACFLAITPAVAGHAAASDRWPSVGVIADTIHVVAAATWLGGLTCVFVALASFVKQGSSESHAVRSLVNAFSPAALASAGGVVASGVLSAWLRLGTIAAIWNSTYGRILLAKLAVLTGVVGTGAYNWLRVRPALGSEAANRRLQRSAAAELAIACAVVVITAILVAAPTPLDSA